MSLDPGLSAIGGGASPSDYDLLTGGLLAFAQDPFSAADNGTLNNQDSLGPDGTPVGTGAAVTPTVPTPPGASSYTPPNWATLLTNLAGTASNIVTTAGGVINGKPVNSPGQAGATPAPGAKTVTAPGSGFRLGTLGIVGLVGAGLWFLTRKRR